MRAGRCAVVGFTMLAVTLLGAPARAGEPQTEAPGGHVAPEKGVAIAAVGSPRTGPLTLGVRVPVPPPPRRARTADPWLTRASMAVTGASSAAVDARIPAGEGASSRYAGSSQAGGLAIDLYGRWLGFDLALTGAYGKRIAGPEASGASAELTAVEGRAGFTGVLWNARGVFVAAGPSVEGRATAVGSFDEGNEAGASWQAAFAGPELRARLFAGPRVFATAHAFLGVHSLGGGWQAVDAAADGEDVIRSGSLEGGRVLSASATVALRPVEWFAMSGGVAWRTASYRFEGGTTGSEQSLRPFVGIEFLY